MRVLLRRSTVSPLPIVYSSNVEVSSVLRRMRTAVTWPSREATIATYWGVLLTGCAV